MIFAIYIHKLYVLPHRKRRLNFYRQLLRNLGLKNTLDLPFFFLYDFFLEFSYDCFIWGLYLMMLGLTSNLVLES